MMNRLMTVKLSVIKKKKTGNRQAVSRQLQISVLSRQKRFGTFLCGLSPKSRVLSDCAQF